MRRTSRTMFLIVCFSALFVVHLSAQFLAWAFHPGNSAVPGCGSALPWIVSSFPLFLVLGQRITTEFFWLVMLTNSCIWSFVLTYLLQLLFVKSRMSL